MFSVAACGAAPMECTPGATRPCDCYGTDPPLAGHQLCLPSGDWDGCGCALRGPCPDRECGADPATGAHCGDCAAGYACSASGFCATH